MFRREPLPLTRWQIIGWWESRRVAYNLVLAITGIFTILVCLISGVVSEMKFGTQFGLPDPPLFAVFGIIFYVLAANTLYAGGWLVEIALTYLWKNPWPDFAPVTLALGLALSVLLTLTPGIISTALTLVQFVVGPLPWGKPELAGRNPQTRSLNVRTVHQRHALSRHSYSARSATIGSIRVARLAGT